MIDYIRYKSGWDKVTYIGVQQGSQIMLMGNSIMPDFFNTRIDLHVALNPQSTLDGYGGFYGFLWYIWSFFQHWFQAWGWYSITERSSYHSEADTCA